MTVPWLCQWCNILLVDDDGEVRSAAAYHQDESKIELLRRLRPDMRRRELSVARVIASGEPELDNHITDEQLSRPLASADLSIATREQLGILRDARAARAPDRAAARARADRSAPSSSPPPMPSATSTPTT